MCSVKCLVLQTVSVWYQSGFVQNNRQWRLLICCGEFLCYVFFCVLPSVVYVLCSVVVYLVSGTKVVLCQTIVNGVGGDGDLA